MQRPDGSSWLEQGFRLGNRDVRPRHGTLSRRDDASAEPVRLEPRVMAVLVCLARHANEVVTRDEFIAEVWGGRIVSDEALSRCISLLRQVLDDDAREPRVIRTVARIGYTLLVSPQPLELTAPAPPVSSASNPPRPKRRTTLIVLCALGLLVAAASVAFVRRSGAPPDGVTPALTRLLVMPFDASASHGVGRELGGELSDEIGNALAHVERLRISGRSSAEALAAAHMDALEAGRKLGVDAVLGGAVSDRADGLKVDVYLVATRDGRTLWKHTYERQASDVFAMQSSIASAVVRELVGRLSPDGLSGVTRVEPQSRDLETYQLYLRGARQVRLRGEGSLRLAVDLFSAALRRDPGYARAQIGLGMAYALLPSYSIEEPSAMYALAEKALDAADRIAGNGAASAGTRAYLAFMRGRWVDAEVAFRTAVVADPNNAEVRQQYSQLLGAMGRMHAALAQARMAQDIDPLSPVIADRLGILYLWVGRDADAASDASLARELGLDEFSYPETRILLKLHQHDDAGATADLHRLLSATQRSEAWVEPMLRGYRHPDQRAAALAVLDRLWAEGGITPRLYYGTSVLLESATRAVQGFDALADRGANDLEFLFSVDAVAVRRDPAFGEFLRRTGIQAYWDRFGYPAACQRNGSGVACS